MKRNTATILGLSLLVSGTGTSIELLRANDESPATQTSTVSLTTSTVPERLLVLNSGRVIRGRLTPRVDGYDVELTNGRLFVDSQQIRFPAGDMDEAYQKMRLTRQELTPNSHVELAQWCDTNQLYREARRELLDALRLDPNRGDAKQLLQTVLQKLEQSGSAASHHLGASADLQRGNAVHRTIGTPAESRSLAGFSRPVAEQFMKQIQPLLVNKCSGGGCHSSGQGDFQLLSIRNGSTPAIAERNLSAVVRQIDLSDPAESVLLSVLTGAHGGRTTPILRGRDGRSQADRLREWVLAAAYDLNPNPVTHTPALAELSPATGTQDQLLPVPRIPVSKTDEAEIRKASAEESFSEKGPHGDQATPDDSDQRILQELSVMNRSDAFDPEIFNQKYHAAKADTAEPGTRRESR